MAKKRRRDRNIPPSTPTVRTTTAGPMGADWNDGSVNWFNRQPRKAGDVVYVNTSMGGKLATHSAPGEGLLPTSLAEGTALTYTGNRSAEPRPANDGKSYYYVEVIDPNGNRVWVAENWVGDPASPAAPSDPVPVSSNRSYDAIENARATQPRTIPVIGPVLPPTVSPSFGMDRPTVIPQNTYPNPTPVADQPKRDINWFKVGGAAAGFGLGGYSIYLLSDHGRKPPQGPPTGGTPVPAPTPAPQTTTASAGQWDQLLNPDPAAAPQQAPLFSSAPAPMGIPQYPFATQGYGQTVPMSSSFGMDRPTVIPKNPYPVATAPKPMVVPQLPFATQAPTPANYNMATNPQMYSREYLGIPYSGAAFNAYPTSTPNPGLLDRAYDWARNHPEAVVAGGTVVATLPLMSRIVAGNGGFTSPGPVLGGIPMSGSGAGGMWENAFIPGS